MDTDFGSEDFSSNGRWLKIKTASRIPEQMFIDGTVKKNCSKCGADFHCGATSEAVNGTESFSCWCTELDGVSVVTDAGQDCLCPDCLTAAVKLAESAPENHRTK